MLLYYRKTNIIALFFCPLLLSFSLSPFLSISISTPQSPRGPSEAETTAEVLYWRVEFQIGDMSMPSDAINVSDPSVLSIIISDQHATTALRKGTEYQARVAGVNIRGLGAFSEFAMGATAVDRKSALK